MVLKKSYVSLWEKITIIYLSFLASSWNLPVVPWCWIFKLLFCWRISLWCRCQCHLSEDDVNIPVSYMTNDSRKECPLNSYFHMALSSLQLNDILFPTMFQLRLVLPLERHAYNWLGAWFGARYSAPNSVRVWMRSHCNGQKLCSHVSGANSALTYTLRNASKLLWCIPSVRAGWMWEHPLFLTLFKRWQVLS